MARKVQNGLNNKTRQWYSYCLLPDTTKVCTSSEDVICASMDKHIQQKRSQVKHFIEKVFRYIGDGYELYISCQNVETYVTTTLDNKDITVYALRLVEHIKKNGQFINIHFLQGRKVTYNSGTFIIQSTNNGACDFAEPFLMATYMTLCAHLARVSEQVSYTYSHTLPFLDDDNYLVTIRRNTGKQGTCDMEMFVSSKQFV